jgi:hypothetical protein
MSKSDEEIVLPTESARKKLKEIVTIQLNSPNFSIKFVEGSKKGDNYIGIGKCSQKFWITFVIIFAQFKFTDVSQQNTKAKIRRQNQKL